MSDSSQSRTSTITHIKTVIIEEFIPLLINSSFPHDSVHSPQRLREIYDTAVIFLLRLLIIMFAEDRGILPSRNLNEYSSLRLIRNDIVNDNDGKKRVISQQYKLFKSFKAICHGLISKFSFKRGIPWNSLLFNEKPGSFLDKIQISDPIMAKLIDSFSWDTTSSRESPQWIDYGDLPVWTLGEIYELLFHYQLSNDKNDLKLVIVQREDKNQKTTGSYYTPAYIAQFLTEKTLGPTLSRIKDDFQEQIEILNDLENTSREEKIQILQRIDPLEKMLKLRILDPAVGTGLFLLETYNFLRNWTRKLIAETYEVDGRPYRFKPLVSQKLTTSNSRNYLYWLILKQCLYGIDVNPIAVDITKISLWLSSSGHPMPFGHLDRRICVGNSLLAVSWSDLQDFLSKIKPSGSLVSSVIAQSTKDTLRQLFHLCLWTQIHEAHDEAFKLKNLHDIVLRLLEKGSFDPSTPFLRKITNEALQEQYFHIDLEFSDGDNLRVSGSQRFDFVLTNPPYGADVPPTLNRYFKRKFKTHKETAAYFVIRILSLSKNFGIILPKSCAFYSQWTRTRSELFRQARLNNVLDAGLSFPNVNFETIGLVGSLKTHTAPGQDVEIAVAQPNRILSPRKTILIENSIPSVLFHQNQVILFRGISAEERRVVHQISQNSISLGGILGSKTSIFRGIYIPDEIKRSVITTRSYILDPLRYFESKWQYVWIDRVPHVKKYRIVRYHLLDLSNDSQKPLRKRVIKVLRKRLFLKVLRGNRLVAYVDSEAELCTTEKLVNVVLPPKCPYSLYFLCGIINSSYPSFYLANVLFSKTTETSRVMDYPYSSQIPIPLIRFTIHDENIRKIRDVLHELVDSLMNQSERAESLQEIDFVKSIEEAIKTHVPNNVDHGLHEAISLLVQKIIHSNKTIQTYQKNFIAFSIEKFSMKKPLFTQLAQEEAAIKLMEKTGYDEWPELRKKLVNEFIIPKDEINTLKTRYGQFQSQIRATRSMVNVLEASVETLARMCFCLDETDQEITSKSLGKGKQNCLRLI